MKLGSEMRYLIGAHKASVGGRTCKSELLYHLTTEQVPGKENPVSQGGGFTTLSQAF